MCRRYLYGLGEKVAKYTKYLSSWLFVLFFLNSWPEVQWKWLKCYIHFTCKFSLTVHILWTEWNPLVNVQFSEEFWLLSNSWRQVKRKRGRQWYWWPYLHYTCTCTWLSPSACMKVTLSQCSNAPLQVAVYSGIETGFNQSILKPSMW